MSPQDDRIRSVISEHRVKLHIFEPSGRRVWTVVGTEREYWIDPEQGFCSCPGYYFGSANGRKWCYHLEAARSARLGGAETTRFADDEYAGFVSGLMCDLWS